MSYCDLSKDYCEPKTPALWWGHGSLGARDSESGSWHGGARFGELDLFCVSGSCLFFSPHRKSNDSVAEVEWNKSSQVGCEQAI